MGADQGYLIVSMGNSNIATKARYKGSEKVCLRGLVVRGVMFLLGLNMI